MASRAPSRSRRGGRRRSPAGARPRWSWPPRSSPSPPEPVFSSVLIANRGEIARRIIRACRSLGIRAIAVYSEADAGWPFVAEADQAVAIGPAPARDSYLSVERILEAARRTGAEAIHPGYGFLSESWRFAKACEEAGLVFIGPPWRVIQQMGDKVGARRLMASAGVPIVPGSDGPVDSVEGARAAAFASAQRRAAAAVGSTDLFVERFLEAPRHIEVQVFGDRLGQVVHLHERECSIQRRHQKLIEESPAPNLPAKLKTRLTAAAVTGAKAVGYVNAGTVEFMVKADRFYFLEMNTRLQVEHPVTEEVTGFDLVQAQIQVAAGEPVPWRQESIVQRGASMECRIYAEDPTKGFLPAPGRVSRLVLPEGPGIRVECGVAEGVDVSVHYDPLLAKLVVAGATRDEALGRMRSALDGFVVAGVKTVIPFHQRVIASAAFSAGSVHTQMVAEGAFNG